LSIDLSLTAREVLEFCNWILKAWKGEDIPISEQTNFQVFPTPATNSGESSTLTLACVASGDADGAIQVVDDM
jgi:hypothetical protein